MTELIHRPGYNPWLAGAAAGLAAISAGERLVAYTQADPAGPSLHRQAELSRFLFSYDHVLGTSFDMILDAGRPADAQLAEEKVLSEIDRLNLILSTYNPDSEISLVKAGAPVRSPELAELLQIYDLWNKRTGGLIDVNLAGVIGLWKAAATADRLPDREALARAARDPFAWNVDALGKGFIIERAVTVARRYAPAGLLNIGGDIRVWGEQDWLIGVADPRQPADNAQPLATFPLREAAVATSGGYARYATIEGKRYSHLIDPRTQWPVDTVRSAAFVAADSITANAFATAASIGSTGAGVRFAQMASASGSLIIGQSGVTTTSGVLSTALTTPVESQETAWPTGFQAIITVTLKSAGGGMGFPGGGSGRRGGMKRPYVAVWIEDSHGKVVRNLTLWAGSERYMPELTTWWRKIGSNRRSAQAVARATRPPGTYTLSWDGLNDVRNPVPMGDYTVFVEINREHGNHVMQAATISCAKDPASADLKVTSESEASSVNYGPNSP